MSEAKDERSYFLVRHDRLWRMVAFSFKYYSNTIPLEIWDDKYSFNRVCYNHADATTETIKGLKEDTKSGPLLYTVTKDDDKKNPVATVWKPAGLENLMVLDIKGKEPVKIQAHGTTCNQVMEQVKQLLAIPNCTVDDITETEVFREFNIK